MVAACGCHVWGQPATSMSGSLRTSVVSLKVVGAHHSVSLFKLAFDELQLSTKPVLVMDGVKDGCLFFQEKERHGKC